MYVFLFSENFAEHFRLLAFFFVTQGRRRVFKSGPAEKIIACRRHERGRAREGDSPSRYGVSPEKILIFLALLCAFLMGFYAFGTRFQSQLFC